MESTERRQTLRHTFLESEGNLIKGTILIDDKEYPISVVDLSLAGMNCYVEKNTAELLKKQSVYNIELNFKNDGNVFIKGQMMWRKEIGNNNNKELSVGFYNFIPDEKHHVNMLEFLKSLN